jgi:arylsulfate sulfotransferase
MVAFIKSFLSVSLILSLAACATPVLESPAELQISLDTGLLSPSFSPSIHNYEVSSLSTLKPLGLKVQSSLALSATLDGKSIPLNQATTVPVSKLSKDQALKLDVTFADRTETYEIQTLPETFPNYTVYQPEAASPGSLLLSSQDWSGKNPSYLMILDPLAQPVYYLQSATGLADFKRYSLPDGSIRYSYLEMSPTQTLTGVNYQEGRIQVLDQDFKNIKSLTLQPYHSELYQEDYPAINADSHDTLMLGPDHYLLMAYYGKEVDNIPAALLKTPGSKVKVVAAVIQEVKDGQVIFQWDSSQYPEFYSSSAVYSSYDSAASWYDYVHINSVEIDPADQNLILSFRHLNQVIKIDRTQGDVIWRLGGKNSDFPLSDEQQFSHQHDARVLPNGDLMLFDNHNPPDGSDQASLSSVKRFRLDLAHHQVTDFQRWQPLPQQYAFAMGSAMQLANGNLLIGWGANQKNSDVTETDAQGKVLFDLSFDESVYSYRAFKYPQL